MTAFKKKLLVEVTITAVIVVALSLGVVFFGWTMEKTIAEIEYNRDELIDRWSSLYTLATLLAEYNDKARVYLGALEQLIPAQDQVFNLNRDFQAVARQVGVTESFTFISETEPGERTLGSIKFQLNVIGSSDALTQFIQSIEQFRYLSKIDAVRVDEAGGRSSAILQGQVFFR